MEGQPWFKQALDRGQLYFVDFAGAPDQRSALKWVRVRGLRATASTILDAGGRDLLAILQVTRAN